MPGRVFVLRIEDERGKLPSELTRLALELPSCTETQELAANSGDPMSEIALECPIEAGEEFGDRKGRLSFIQVVLAIDGGMCQEALSRVRARGHFEGDVGNGGVLDCSLLAQMDDCPLPNTMTSQDFPLWVGD